MGCLPIDNSRGWEILTEMITDYLEKKLKQKVYSKYTKPKYIGGHDAEIKFYSINRNPKLDYFSRFVELCSIQGGWQGKKIATLIIHPFIQKTKSLSTDLFKLFRLIGFKKIIENPEISLSVETAE